MNILFILQYIPYPLNSGGNQATFNMIDKVREEHSVSILCNLRNRESQDAMKQLQEVWPDVKFFPYIEKRNKISQEDVPPTLSFRLCEFLRQSFTRKVNRRIKNYRNELAINGQQGDFVRANSCLHDEFPTFSKDYKNYVYQVARMGFDAIQIEFYESMPLVYLLPSDITKIYVQHEIRYVRNQNELDLFKQQTPADIYQWNLLKDLELKALSHYNHIISLTETDKQQMLSEDKKLNIYVSPAVVKRPQKKFTFTPTNTELVFIGSGAHFPNVDGMMWFCQEVMPLIKIKQKKIKVNVVGKWNKKLRKQLLNIEPSIHFTGFVEDLESYINGKVSIVPIRIGSGMRMKLLDSIIAASPIVTTSKGCEGLPFKDRECCLISDTPTYFANSIIELLENANMQKALVENAFDSISNIIDEDRQIKRRLQLYREIVQNATNKNV